VGKAVELWKVVVGCVEDGWPVADGVSVGEVRAGVSPQAQTINKTTTGKKILMVPPRPINSRMCRPAWLNLAYEHFLSG
jgi:hypothetical protein